MAQVTFDTVELENFVKRLGKAAHGDFKRALNKFLEGLGMEFLRILQDEIVRRNVLDYRLLLHSFQKGDGENVWTLDEFLSTPSARRATAKTETKSLFSYKLYNILHEFRRALIYNGSKSYPNHAK